MEKHDHQRVGVVAGVGAVCCWSAGNIMVREIELPSLWLAFWRMVIGAVVYTAVLLIKGQRLRWPEFKACITVAALSGFWFATFFEALQSTTIANVTMIGALLPVVLFAVAARKFAEPVTLWLVGMCFVALAGLALVLYGSTGLDTWSARGDLFALVTLVLWPATFAMTKSVRQHVGALEFQATVWIVGAVVLAPVATISTGGIVWPSGVTWAWVAAMLAVPGTGHLLMTWAHRHVKLTLTSMTTLAVAPLSMMGAAIFQDEPVVGLQIFGAVVVMVVLVLVIRREARIDQTTSKDETPLVEGVGEPPV